MKALFTISATFKGRSAHTNGNSSIRRPPKEAETQNRASRHTAQTVRPSASDLLELGMRMNLPTRAGGSISREMISKWAPNDGN